MTTDLAYRILVIDDEERLRTSCRRVLEPEGYEVTEAPNGMAGLQMIQDQPPDLVLVDLMMPRMTGMELMAAARQTHPDLAIVVITGYATMEKAVEAMKEGADDFLAKPFKPQDLRLVVTRALKQVATLEAMAREKSRTRALVQSMSSGVLVVNSQGQVVWLNRSLAAMLGLDEREAAGLAAGDVLPAGPVLEAVLASVEPGGAPEPESPRLEMALGHDPNTIHLEVACSSLRDRRGRLVGGMAVFEDVTDRFKLDRLRNEYVSTVAHDIASPLGSVLSQLQTIQRGLAGELTEKQAHLISRASLRVRGIIDLSKDLLDLARMENQGGPEMEEVDLGRVLSEALEVIASAAREKDQQVKADLPLDLPSPRGSARGLLQVFTNLLSNAVRYTPNGGKVELSAQALPGKVRVAVSDNGLGIPAEEQERIFERFYRVKNADTRSIVGTGLGLPIVKKVVEQHQGTIEVQSNPGQGSTFTVTLPLESDK